MDLRPFVEALRHELSVAAEAGGDEARALADRLTAPLESATRLVLLEALSAAADEITRDMAPGSVDVRLRGREPGFVVSLPPSDDAQASVVPAAVPVASDGDDGPTSRINLRMPDSLKARVEEAASSEHLSVNTWLVRAASAALDPVTRAPRGAARSPRGGGSFTGWVR